MIGFFVALAVGAASGVLSGMGIGGGTLLLLWLTAVMHLPAETAAGYNLLYFLCCSPTALISHIKQKRVDKAVVIYSLLGGVPACFLARCIGNAINTDWLHRAFGILLVLVGLRELFAKKSPLKHGNENNK